MEGPSPQQELFSFLKRAGLHDLVDHCPPDFTLGRFLGLTDCVLRECWGLTDGRDRARVLAAVRKARSAEESDKEVSKFWRSEVHTME